MIHLYNSNSLAVSRWRNGGGETREIVSYPSGAVNFDWRISIATIAADGDFSLFPGVDRIITLLSGDGVELCHGEQLYQRLEPYQPFAFAGEDPVTARLLGKSSTDFNIMARRDSYSAEANITSEIFSPPNTVAGVVYVLHGQWQHGQTLLAVGQGAWWENQCGSFAPLSTDALLLWGTLIPVVNRDF